MFMNLRFLNFFLFSFFLIWILFEYVKMFCILGEQDHLPEVAFYMIGNLEEVIAKAEKLAEEQSWAALL